jgi:branched-chain amino acid transport system substrate-binding protein
MPGSSDFSFRYRLKYGVNADYNAAGGYAAGQIIEAAVRLAGSIDKDKVREQLATMKFRSLIGHFRVDENRRQVGKPNYVIQWQEGRRRLIYPENLARFEMDYPFPPWKDR